MDFLHLVSGCLVFVGLSLVVSCGVSFLTQHSKPSTEPDVEIGQQSKPEEENGEASESGYVRPEGGTTGAIKAQLKLLRCVRRWRKCSPQLLLLLVSRVMFPTAFMVFNAIYWQMFL